MMTLGNPLGLLALLGIPAVLAIHFLQRRAKQIPITTLFLLEKTQRESARGRRFDRLMNSVPLWMQLLAMLLLTWLLIEPRYQKAQSTQRIAIVLDSSASMSVFKDAAINGLAKEIPKLQGAATRLQLTMRESHADGATLYTGNSTNAALEAIRDWQPRHGLTDPSSALRTARSVVGREGLVVFATDTPMDDPPYDTRVLAVGETIENVGITGIEYQKREGTWVWHAVVRNYADHPATRTWQLQYPDGSASQPQSFSIEPKAMVSLQAALPGTHDRAVLVLSGDAFTLDDTAPLITPQPKNLTLFTSTSPAFAELAKRLTKALDAVETTHDESSADLSIVSYDPLDPALPSGHAVIFVNDDVQAGAYLKGGIVAEPHPLIDDLNWQTLLVRESLQLERQPIDRVLLWQGTRPLIFLRQINPEDGGSPIHQLFFNFDLRHSNALTQPAFIICLHRFSEMIRAKKVAPMRTQLETGQPFSIATHATPKQGLNMQHKNLQGTLIDQQTLPAVTQLSLRAPREPGFTTITHEKGEPLYQAAVIFGDPREADFSACASANTLGKNSRARMIKHTREDHWWRLWVLLLLVALAISWKFSHRSRTEPNEPKMVGREGFEPS